MYPLARWQLFLSHNLLSKVKSIQMHRNASKQFSSTKEASTHDHRHYHNLEVNLKLKFMWVGLKWRVLSPVVPMSWINGIAICPLPGFKKKRPTTTPGNDTLHRATGLPGHNYTILFSPSLSFFFSFIVAQLTQNSTSICICTFEINRIMPATI